MPWGTLKRKHKKRRSLVEETTSSTSTTTTSTAIRPCQNQNQAPEISTWKKRPVAAPAPEATTTTNSTSVTTNSTTPKKKNSTRRRRHSNKRQRTSGTDMTQQQQQQESKSNIHISKKDNMLIFQNVIQPYTDYYWKQKRNQEQEAHVDDDNDDDNDDDDNNNYSDVSLAFFELANAPLIGYRLQQTTNTDKPDDSLLLMVQQDVTACGQHTGGIVWETAYLLLHYLLHLRKKNNNNKNNSKQKQRQSLFGTTVEIGAGCGLLGLALAKMGVTDRCILTETSQVWINLQANLELNIDIQANVKNINDSGLVVSSSSPSSSNVRACPLDWRHYKRDIQAANLLACDAPTSTLQWKTSTSNGIDCIVGTDVLFHPTLVQPLLDTLRYLCLLGKDNNDPHNYNKDNVPGRRPSTTMENKNLDNQDGTTKMQRPIGATTATATGTTKGNTIIYICVQIRCPTSHEMFVNQAANYDLHLEDISNELLEIPECWFGPVLDCYLFRLQHFVIHSPSVGTAS